MKQIHKVLCAVLCVVMMLTLVQPTQTVAAKEQVQTTTKKVVIHDKTYGKIRVESYYEKILLKGNTKAIKNINQTLRKIYNQWDKSMKLNVAGIVDYAKMDAYRDYPDTYFDRVYADVSYNGNSAICIKFSSETCLGGVNNTDVWGMTFSLKTGKQLRLDQVCVSKPSKAAAALKKKILNEDKWADVSKVTVKNMKNMSFYLEPGQKAVVCFGPYELGSGGWARTYTLKSKFK